MAAQRNQVAGRRRGAFLAAVVAAFATGWLWPTRSRAETPPALSVTWQQAERIPSSEERSAWFPDLAVDLEGRVHVTFCSTNHTAMARQRELKNKEGKKRIGKHKLEELHYSRLENGHWSAAESIALKQQPIFRNSIAVDWRDVLHLVFGFSPGWGYDLHYRQAPASAGFTERDWRVPERLNTRFNTYLSDLATSDETLHVVYDDRGSPDDPCRHCADIFYLRSPDRGVTWSPPVSLRPSPIGSSRAQIAVDGAGTVYVSWDEGWDRLSGRGTAKYGIFMASAPGEERWTEPLIIRDPNEQNAQLTVAATGRGGVMLVWRTTSSEYPGIFYQWSEDWGRQWSKPETIPGVIARRWDSPFDMYTMATDGGGNIHLIASARPDPGKPLAGPIPDKPPHGLYHLAWNGERWTTPYSVYTGDEYPEYPRLVVAKGNELHTTFFTRAETDREERPHRIWYVRGSIDSPLLPVGPPLPAKLVATYSPVPDRLSPGFEKKTDEVTQPIVVRWTSLIRFLVCLGAGAVIVAVVQLGARLTTRLRR